jgi:hypothetical protein
MDASFYIDPTSLLAAAAKEAATEAIGNRRQLRRLASQILRLLTQGPLRLAVFGAGGAGKSTFGRFIAEEGDVAPEAYEESITDEVYDVPRALRGKLTVVPGQRDRMGDYWSAQYRELAKGRTRGLVNVVAYGYHTFKMSYRDASSIYRDGMAPAQFVADHTAARRAREVELLAEMQPRLEDADGEPWMITLVTKQDLWWDERDDVEAFYRDGRYGDIIRAIQAKRGARHFQHEYVSASLVLSNFVSGTGELLKRTTAGYDDHLKLAHQGQLLRVIHDLTERR